MLLGLLIPVIPRIWVLLKGKLINKGDYQIYVGQRISGIFHNPSSLLIIDADDVDDHI
jgi:uncharacterized protein YqgC (DUF456 family)